MIIESVARVVASGPIWEAPLACGTDSGLHLSKDRKTSALILMRNRESIEMQMPDAAKIRGIYSFETSGETSVKPSPVAVFAHGFGSTRGGEKSAAVEAECARRGWAFAAFDFRGHGQSDGTMLELRGSRLLQDLEVITSEVGRRAKGPLLLAGSSMGGWASAWFAARHPERVSACALIAPAFRLLEWSRLSEAEREAWRETGRHRVTNEFVDVEIGYQLAVESERYRFEILTKNFRSPAIIFHGMADTMVPYTTSIEFTSACASKDVELLIIKDGDHRLNREREEIARAACDFFARQCTIVMQ